MQDTSSYIKFVMEEGYICSYGKVPFTCMIGHYAVIML